MKAALYRAYGTAAETLRVEEVDRPEPGPGQVRVRMQLSGVNPTDWKSRSGATPRPIEGFQVPHHDGSGVIDAVGPGVEAGRVGERVWVWMAAAGNRWGTAAQWSVLPARQAVPLPDGASTELGACLGVPDQAAADIRRALPAGALTELPVTRFGLDDVAAAHDAVEAGAVGKVVIEIP
jgi:NADPH2:quinone reductase